MPDSPERLRRITEGARRVLVMGGGWAGYNHVKWLGTRLTGQGFVMSEMKVFGTETVEVWTHDG